MSSEMSRAATTEEIREISGFLSSSDSVVRIESCSAMQMYNQLYYWIVIKGDESNPLH
jgi:hypothetical protein